MSLEPRATSPSVIATLHVSVDGSTLESGGALLPRQRIPIASVTKTLTALLAAHLRSAGVLDWDAATEFRDRTGSPLTLRTLLSHTAHLPSELYPRHWILGESLTQADLDSLSGRAPALELPPLTWHYSNLGYALAARVLQTVTGEDYASLLHRTLLEPLGMTDTSFAQPAEAGAMQGAGAAAGGLWSTLEDLVALGEAIAGDNPVVVSTQMLSCLLERATPDSTGALLGAGLRLQPDRKRHRLLVATGTLHDKTTCLAVWPRRGISVLVADAGYSHADLWTRAILQWRRPAKVVRTWWLDGQPVDEVRAGDTTELLIEESAWPFPYFSGRAGPGGLTGIDWYGRAVTLRRGSSTLTGPYGTLTSEPRESAYRETDDD